MVWISKYCYHGDTKLIANHTKLLLGVSHVVSGLLGPFMGILFDKCGELVVTPIIFFIAAGPYFGLYFLQDFDSAFGYTLQILTASATSLTSTLNIMLLTRHSPLVGAGKIFALNSVISGLIMIGFKYMIGWVIDQPFNRWAFITCGVGGMLVVVTFLMISCCCSDLSQVQD